MSQLEFVVTGMVCSGCSDTVKSVVGAISGVGTVSVDHESGATSVSLEGASEDSVYAAIRDAGFGVKTCGNSA